MQNMEKFEQRESKRAHDRQNMEKFEQRASKRGTGLASGKTWRSLNREH
jgi:hypothetical protein